MTLWDALLNVYALFAVLPFVTFIIIWFIANKVWRDARKATLLAGDITTVFLIAAVAVELDILFPNWFGGIWLIFMLLLIAVGLLGGAQHRLKGKVNIRKLVRIIWRLSFLLLSFAYILFAIILIIKGFL